MSAAAPSVGSSAATPGNAVEASKAMTATPIADRPAQPSPAAANVGIRGTRTIAIAAPSASSHARARVEK
jgi:hypothetical protein